ncbi:MAG: hypothetical protein LBQ47_03260 [Endomicrobium sp.]|jgi:hypothetical protein|nr:hypothetical protein [Endomicrobium sp.]
MERKICPKCNSQNTAYILYGLPIMSGKLRKQIDKGTLVLGGCCVTDNATHHCNDCTHNFKASLD